MTPERWFEEILKANQLLDSIKSRLSLVAWFVFLIWLVSILKG